jgi:hypothetical protein
LGDCYHRSANSFREAEISAPEPNTPEKGDPMPERTDPIIIETAGMRMTVDYRRGVGGDEGLTFDITVAGGAEEAGQRVLRFDCFKKTPHYHIGPSGKYPVRNMKDEGIDDPVRWSLTQLKTRVVAMVTEAGYEDIAARIDQQAIADSLSRVEKDIFAKI